MRKYIDVSVRNQIIVRLSLSLYRSAVKTISYCMNASTNFVVSIYRWPFIFYFLKFMGMSGEFVVCVCV